MAPFKDIAKFYVKLPMATRPDCKKKIEAEVKKTFGDLNKHN